MSCTKDIILKYLKNDKMFLSTITMSGLTGVFNYNINARTDAFIHNALNRNDESFSTESLRYVTDGKYLTQFKNKIDETKFIMILNYNWSYYRAHYGDDYQLVLPVTKEYVLREFISIWMMSNFDSVQDLIIDFVHNVSTCTAHLTWHSCITG